MRASILGVCAAIALILAASVAAHAADNSFYGSCYANGTATLDKPVTGTPQDNVIHARGTGGCDGTLNAARIANAPIETASDVPFNGSCYSNHSTAPGPSFLKFTRGTARTADDVVIRFALTFESDAVNGTTLHLRGEKSGAGSGHSEVPTEDVSAYVSQCETGGVSKVRFTSYSYTYSPLVSEDLPMGGGFPTAGTRLRLGPTRGMRSARPGRPFLIRVRALGGSVRNARVAVRDARGRRVARSRRFSVGSQSRRVRVSVTHRLRAGRYRISVAGLDAAGTQVSAVKRVRLRSAKAR
jgi:hypothetical protein